ncbi:MAG: hypothetical protein R2701_03125 [Acidimicrobiales bacterium]
MARHRQEGLPARSQPAGARGPGPAHRGRDRRLGPRRARRGGAGATIRGSTVRGPAIVAAGATIVDSYVGPFTSIGEGTSIATSEIENSVVLERVKIEGVPRLVDSLIGRDSEITRSHRPPKATRLLLGDHCAVDLQ